MITRYHPVLSVPIVTIRGMAGDQETVTAAAAVTAGGDLVTWAGARPPGPVAIAAELLARTRAELPVLAGLGEREELLAGGTVTWSDRSTPETGNRQAEPLVSGLRGGCLWRPGRRRRWAGCSRGWFRSGCVP